MARKSPSKNRKGKHRKSAERVRAAGRYGDTRLVHVNPGEMQQMEDAWGPPSINPETGLPEHNFFSKLAKTAKSMRSHVHAIFKGAGKALQGKGSIFGGTPLGTKLSNAVTGRHDKPITDQYGGMTPEEKAAYKDKNGVDSLGYSSELHQIGSAIGSYYGGQALGGLASSGASSLGASPAVSSLASRVATYEGRQLANNPDYGTPSDSGFTLGGSSSGSPSGFNNGTLASQVNSGSTMGTTKLPKGSSYTTTDPWYSSTAQAALGRATELADRPYNSYGGERVAGLSTNEQQAGSLAAQTPGQLQPIIGRLQGGFSTESLQPYMNPYTDAVLGARTRGINDEFGHQAADLSRNQAATDAFRSGRSDLARARLQSSKMRALDEATNQVKSDAFNAGTQAYFNQRNSDANALGAISGANQSAVGALESTGAADRQVRQANNDFNYGQFLERRDWDVNNLNNLLSALGTTRAGAGTLTIGKAPDNGQSAANWGALVGVAANAVGQYYGSGGGGGGTGGYYGSDTVNTGGSMSDYGGGDTGGGGFGATYGA